MEGPFCKSDMKSSFRESNCTYNTLHSGHTTVAKRIQLFIFETGSTVLNSSVTRLCLTVRCNILALIQLQL